MIDVQVSGGNLEVSITDGDVVLLTSRKESWNLTVPVDHISRAMVGKPRGFASKKHIFDTGGGLLVCARPGDPVVDIHLDGRDQFQSLILSVPDPEDTVATIKGALRRLGR
jgi:hypothetical protein